MFESGNPQRQPRRKKTPRWVYCPIDHGKSVTGWLAGKPVWVLCHHVGTSKPCKRAMTQSALICPYCEDRKEPVWRGFTPFYDADYSRRFVLLPEEQQELSSEIQHLHQIRISRGKGTREPCVMRPENWRTVPLPPSSERAFEVDLRPFLLLLWKDEELTSWCVQAEQQKLKSTVDDSFKAVSLSDDPAIKNLKNRIAKQKEGEKLLADSLPMMNGVHLGSNGKKPKS